MLEIAGIKTSTDWSYTHCFTVIHHSTQQARAFLENLRVSQLSKKFRTFFLEAGVHYKVQEFGTCL